MYRFLSSVFGYKRKQASKATIQKLTGSHKFFDVFHIRRFEAYVVVCRELSLKMQGLFFLAAVLPIEEAFLRSLAFLSLLRLQPLFYVEQLRGTTLLRRLPDVVVLTYTKKNVGG